MESVDKKKLSNEKRLQAIRERQKAQKLQTQGKPIKNFGLEPRIVKENKKQLFDPDEDFVDEDDAFRIRPQFEGEKGKELFERNTELSDRFKLDERFAEKEKRVDISEKSSEENEKTKNLQILESLLGYEVTQKHTEGKKSKRSLPRYDPENESSAKYLKVQHESGEKTRKKSSKKKEVAEKVEEVPVSKERYIEVAKDLKELFENKTPSFSFTSKLKPEIEDKSQKFSFSFASSSADQEESGPIDQNEKFEFHKESTHNDQIEAFPESSYEDKNKYTFFILPPDDRLKEGVQFFIRPKPIDELREEWNQNKEFVLDLFKSKRKSNIRRYAPKSKTLFPNQRKRVFIKE